MNICAEPQAGTQVATAVPDIGNQLTAEQGLTDMQSSAADSQAAPSPVDRHEEDQVFV